jgi:hypothetical protein
MARSIRAVDARFANISSPGIAGLRFVAMTATYRNATTAAGLCREQIQ